jgi:hypothetical protein
MKGNKMASCNWGKTGQLIKCSPQDNLNTKMSFQGERRGQGVIKNFCNFMVAYLKWVLVGLLKQRACKPNIVGKIISKLLSQ